MQFALIKMSLEIDSQQLFDLYRGSILLGLESANPKLCQVSQQEQEQDGAGASPAAAPQEQVSR